jgi:hypothetical protein
MPTWREAPHTLAPEPSLPTPRRALVHGRQAWKKLSLTKVCRSGSAP